jgi:hypothetical protein
MKLQHYRALLYSGREVTEVLNQNSEGKWTGRNGTVAWPGRSPNLNQLFSFYGVAQSPERISVVQDKASVNTAINETRIGIRRNELGRMQWQRLMARLYTAGLWALRNCNFSVVNF